jgi:DNA polymerase III subunit delta'
VRMRISSADLQIGGTGGDTDFASRINKVADISQQQAIVEELDRAVYYIERNANSKMLFHALTIKLYHIIKNKIVFLAD